MEGCNNMNDNFLIVKNPFFESEIKKNGCNCEPLYKSYSKFSLRLGNLTRNVRFFERYNLNPVLEHVEEEAVVIFDGGTKLNTLRWFAQKYKEKRLIFYYWNPVSLSISPELIPQVFEKWSYSPSDCKKYGLKYNSTFFFPELADGKEMEIEQDVFFVGKNKSRKVMLEYYESFFQKKGFSTNFVIIGDCGTPLLYSEIIERDIRSKAIFDYYTDPQAGLSLRAMEALFLERKLITNNLTIMDYDFYNPDNIFVIGQRNNAELESFLESPSELISGEVKDRYSFKQWVNRFNC